MPAAGFYPIESHTIRFGRDGEWYSDGQRIENPRIAALFSRCVRSNPTGGFLLQMGDERAALEVEDTPYVVRSVEGDGEHGVAVRLNDDTVEPLDPSTVRIGADDAFVCRVKDGTMEARFLRAAHYQLARFVTPAEGGRFSLRLGGRTFPIAPRDLGPPR